MSNPRTRAIGGIEKHFFCVSKPRSANRCMCDNIRNRTESPTKLLLVTKKKLIFRQSKKKEDYHESCI